MIITSSERKRSHRRIVAGWNKPVCPCLRFRLLRMARSLLTHRKDREFCRLPPLPGSSRLILRLPIKRYSVGIIRRIRRPSASRLRDDAGCNRSPGLSSRVKHLPAEGIHQFSSAVVPAQLGDNSRSISFIAEIQLL